MPNEQRPLESLSKPEWFDLIFIKAYNEGLNSRQIKAKYEDEYPQWSRNFIDNRLKLMAALGEVTLRPHGGNTGGATKRGPKGKFVSNKEE